METKGIFWNVFLTWCQYNDELIVGKYFWKYLDGSFHFKKSKNEGLFISSIWVINSDEIGSIALD